MTIDLSFRNSLQTPFFFFLREGIHCKHLVSIWHTFLHQMEPPFSTRQQSIGQTTTCMGYSGCLHINFGSRLSYLGAGRKKWSLSLLWKISRYWIHFSLLPESYLWSMPPKVFAFHWTEISRKMMLTIYAFTTENWPRKWFYYACEMQKISLICHYLVCLQDPCTLYHHNHHLFSVW